jgi:hypothetical protein
MKNKRGPKPRQGNIRRIQFRLSDAAAEVCDRYSDQERSEIFEKALFKIFPAVKDAVPTPTLIRPRKVKTETVCRIEIKGRVIQLWFPEKRDDFRDLVKRFRYTWDGCWSRTFREDADILDRAAEIGDELILAGFCVRLDLEDARERLIAQSFIPEPFKLISKRTSGDWVDHFVFGFPKEGDWYDEIMKITGVKYVDKSLYVPPENFEEVLDFAEINGFELSEGALVLVEQARSMRESAIILDRSRKQKKSRAKKNGCKPSEVTVPAHLRDDSDD